MIHEDHNLTRRAILWSACALAAAPLSQLFPAVELIDPRRVHHSFPDFRNAAITELLLHGAIFTEPTVEYLGSEIKRVEREYGLAPQPLSDYVALIDWPATAWPAAPDLARRKRPSSEDAA
jgi:hypothetical protein